MASGGCRSIHVSNLDPKVDESLLSQIFSTAGQITQIKIAQDRTMAFGGLSQAYIEFADHGAAETALATLNQTRVYDMPITIEWSFANMIGRAKEDTTHHFHLWVGDLAPDVDDSMIYKAFSQIGIISDARVMWDTTTGKSRGYGFVSYKTKDDAEKAIQKMTGYQLGSKQIRVNWAHQRNAMVPSMTPTAANTGTYSSAPVFEHPKKPSLNYNHVVSQTTPMHTTVYIGNIPPNTTQDMMTPAFQAYGHILDIKVHADRGFAFVKLDSHENAAQAICYLNGALFNGSRLKCSWGKDKSADALFSVQQLQQQQQTSAYAPAQATAATNTFAAPPGYGTILQAPGGGYDPNQFADYYNAAAYGQQNTAYDPNYYFHQYYQQLYNQQLQKVLQMSEQQQQPLTEPQLQHSIQE